MKKLLIVLAFGLFSCSSDSTESTPVQEETCYNIIARGYDERGNYIIINYANFVQRRYAVSDYQQWLNQTQLCEPITLTQQQL
jgi:hypothetical protein